MELNFNDETATTSISNHTPYNPVPVNIRVLDILNKIQSAGFTLRTFLLAAVQCEDSDVRGRVGMFEAHGGPAALINEWATKLDNKNADTTFVEAATDVVIARARKDIRRVCDNKKLATPASKLTHAQVEGFSLDPIEKELKKSAPCLLRLLRGLAYKEKRLRKNKKMKEIEKKKTEKEKGKGKKVMERDDDEDDEDDEDLPYPKGEITTIVTTIASMLIFRQSQQSNQLQMTFGLYFAATRCPKRVVNVLASIGLCVSAMTVHNALVQLSDDMMRMVQEAVLKCPFFILFDNINMANKKHDQRTNNVDTFENGITATIVIGLDLGPSTPAHGPLREPELLDFLPDQNNRSHMRLVYQFHLVNVLQRHYRTFERCTIQVLALDVLPTIQTITFPLRASRHDQSTNEGNLDFLEEVTRIMLKLPEDWFDEDTRIIVSGDQLTVSRVTSLKELRASDTTPFNRLEWAVPVMQLFHLQMIFCSTILRIHHGTISTPGSLAFFIAMLGRKRLNLDSPNYHAADQFIRHVFDAMVRHLFEGELNSRMQDNGNQDDESQDDENLDAEQPHINQSDTQEPHAQEPHVEELHVEELHVEELHVEELHVEEPHAEEPQAERAYAEVPYATTLEYDMLDFGILDDNIFNNGMSDYSDDEEVLPKKIEALGEDCTDDAKLDRIVREATEALCQKYLIDQQGNPGRLGNANANAAMFLRDMMVYMEMDAAIKVGDIGRVLEALKMVLIMFQSKETKNYANELLRLAYGIHHAWSPQWTKAVTSSWLINTNGRPDGWIPADLYQEHNNLLTKTVYAGKGSNMSWDMLSRKISTNIRLFSKICKALESEYDITYNSTFHSTVSAEQDIQKIQNSLKEHNILGDPRPGDCSVPLDQVTPLLRALRMKIFKRRKPLDHF
ncbi:hypothetical protein BGX28_000146 [Mortierella sp. GBA30]|nr:hypothetical protein BGX28_000146 [Mortierella sp. GBA30]